MNERDGFLLLEGPQGLGSLSSQLAGHEASCGPELLTPMKSAKLKGAKPLPCGKPERGVLTN